MAAVNANIPIDIHYNKLLDWMISRHHCSKQWFSEFEKIKPELDIRIQSLDTEMKAESFLTYYSYLEILEKFKEEDSDSKTLFGGYSSQRVKDWQNVIQQLEANNIFLADATRTLIRLVNYEVPALKKRSTKCQTIQQESIRKDSENAKTIHELHEKYKSTCKELGIEGKHVKRELMSLVRDLPATFERITTTLTDLKPSIQYYEEFLKFTLGRSRVETLSILPTLQYLIERGNTTVFEWKNGKAPDVVEEPKLDFTEDEGKDVEEINWEPSENQEGEIDFGDDIDWGESADVEIEVIDTGIEEPTDADPPKDVKVVATGNNALSVLDFVGSRNQFINDLVELKAFLSQRYAEMTSLEGGLLFNAIMQDAPPSILIDNSKLSEMLGSVSLVLNELECKRMQHLLLIRNSPSYVHRLADTVLGIQQQAAKLGRLEQLNADRRKAAYEEQISLQPKIEGLVQKVRVLKKQLESEISKKYQDRPVNIMGEINML